MHSLLMLLSAGMKLNNVDEVIPIVFDTDTTNGNFKTFDELTSLYNNIQSEGYKGYQANNGDFFATKVSKVTNIGIDGNSLKTLREVIKDINFDSNNKYFTDLFFSEENLSMPLKKGFIGNPNIGSVVLDHIIKNSKSFESIFSRFEIEDRIFIISSIFGGTGAAGFPLLMKHFRLNEDFSTHEFLKGSTIGALSVLPYFDVDKEDDTPDEDEFKKYQVDSASFISKTKAALLYYDSHLKSSINELYFIGDSIRSKFPNNKGGEKQKNNSSFIELAGALSLIDFCKGNTNQEQTFYNMFSLGKKNNNMKILDIDLSHFDENHDFVSSLVKQHLFRLYFQHLLDSALISNTLVWKNTLKLDKDFKKTTFGKYLTQYFEYYDIWLADLKNSLHHRKFDPFISDGIIDSKTILKKTKNKPYKVKKNYLGFDVSEIKFNDVFGNILVKNDSTLNFIRLMDIAFEEIYNKWYE